jgi:hypothetical protein
MLKMRKLAFFILLILFAGAASAQQVVNGVVKDSLGTALAGTTVVIKGTSNHGIADENGSFTQWGHTRKGKWRSAHSPILTRALSNSYLKQEGFTSLIDIVKPSKTVYV